MVGEPIDRRTAFKRLPATRHAISPRLAYMSEHG